MKVAPTQRRTSTQDGPDGWELIVPAKRNIFVMLFLAVWLAGWVMGEVTAARQLIWGPSRDGTAFLLVWLTAWTVGGAFAIYTLLWMLAGRERVVVRHDALLHHREIFGLSRTREYDLAHLSNLRAAPVVADPWSQGMRFWGVGGGIVAFDYGARTIRFADGLDEAEAALVVADIKGRLGSRAA